MTKKEHLEVQQIYTYQGMSLEELSTLFTKLGIKDGARLFYLMLRSFSIAARVANSAWGFYKEWKTGSDGILTEEERMAEALHDYSPDNFGVPAGKFEFAAQCFEDFYNEATTKQTKEEVEELLFEWTKKLRAQIPHAVIHHIMKRTPAA